MRLQGRQQHFRARFSIYVDPEAADIVFKSGASLVVMPLEVTHKALTSHP